MSGRPAPRGRLMPALVGWHVRIGELVGRLFVLHLVWLLGVVAGGVILGAAPATMALNAVIRRDLLNQALDTRNLVVAERPGLWQEFWRVWRQEFWRAQAIGGVVLVGWVVFGLDRLVLRGGIGGVTPWFSGIVVVLSVLWAAVTFIVWPVAVHFDEPLPRVTKLVVVLALSRPAHSLTVLAVVAGWLWLWRACPGLIPVFGVALPAWCVSWLYWHSGVLPLPESAVPYDDPDDVDAEAAIRALAEP
ncbi:Hypothetical protein ACGLYG10_0576 [Actinomyces glycerinitolerans]|uniref:DUF624 domain-containing protein n=2 Tax=Actinomyces glycerinitolerans TaxID=1892869 RepID=A0A1M4RWL6_9ACTO|nr:Hypothetical protein ACGLYG10_0576 [Actinomyces glycerinitolerans]